MKRILLIALTLAQMPACKTGDSPIPQNENVDLLYEQFHGRYKIVSSETSEALDVNLDGVASINLMTELEALQDEPLMGPSIEVRIHKASKAAPAPGFSFMQAWPEQFLRMGPGKVWDGIEMIPFNPNYSFAYDLKVLYRKLAFSEDLKTLTITPSEGENTFFLQSVPKSVNVQPDGKIVVVTERKIYTSSGVKEVLITTVFERYTMTT
ncbi:hypothetical protein [Dyadobacter sp. MSC1_007]|jgi:hypothetical protein|uniref:hypothetical protein n=1 Tax=Dyadobacter sp. MSC1_007 TaxID=2909264 RepID=UPI00202E6031|nr:hypothetical protein [Dyadobacter sp. MSC1_007]